MPQLRAYRDWDNLLLDNKVFKCSNDQSFFDHDNFDVSLDDKNNIVVDIDDIVSDKVLSPFETIGILTKNELPQLNSLPARSGNYEVAVPALYLYWLKTKESTARTYKKVSLALNVIGFVSGVGMAVNATTWTVRIIGTLDAVASAAAIGMDVLPIDQLLIKEYGPNSPEYAFYKDVQLILTIYNVASAGANLAGLPKKLDDAIVFWKANKLRMQSQAGLGAKQVERLDNLLNDANKAVDAVILTENLLAKYPNIRKVLAEVDPILKSAGFERTRFEMLIRQSDNLKYLEENAELLTEIASKLKPAMKYSDADILKMFKDAVDSDFVEFLLPTGFVNSLKTFGKTEDEIVAYFRKYHNIYTRGEFFTQIENIIVKDKSLTSAEGYGIWGYTTNFFYRDLNTWLREGSNAAKTQEIVTLLKRAIQKVPKYDGVAYRALEFKENDLVTFMNKYKQSEVVTFDDFLSCGSTKEAAFFNKPSKNVRITMEVNNAPDISSFADGIKFRGYSPKELLLDTGRKFQITSAKFENGIYELRMVQIN
jgi:hypothetical protein